jgi:hypothetical protein
MSPRRACRKDVNHDLIAETFRKAGCLVLDTHQVAQYIAGYPDLDVRWGARSVLVEVKTADGTLTDDERAFAWTCMAYYVPCVVVRTEGQALALVETLKRGERGHE